MKHTFKALNPEEQGAFEYGLNRIRTNPKASPMQAINLYCDYLCPHKEGDTYTCRNKSCPFGIVKEKMNLVRRNPASPSKSREWVSTVLEENPSSMPLTEPKEGMMERFTNLIVEALKKQDR